MTETKIKSNKSRLWIAAGVILAVVITGILLVSAYNRKISDQLYTERSQGLITVTRKSADGLDSLIRRTWVSLGSAEKLLGYDSKEHPELYEKASQLGDRAVWLQDYLQLSRDEKTGGLVLLLDSNLKVYCGDGHKSRWEEIDFLNNDRDICITRLTYQSEDDSSIFFIHKLSEKITVGKTQLTHIIINIPVSSFAGILRVEEYRDQNFTYVVGRGGERMCRYQQSASFIDTYNVLHLLEDAKYTEGSTAEDIRQCLIDDNGGNCCISFEYDGVSYYAATAKLNGTDWHIISFVPTDILSDTAKMFRTSTYTFFIELSLLILIAVTTCIALAISATNQAKLSRRQEEMNVKLAEAAEKAEAASTAKTVFLSNMSHDIRTPINGIMGMLAIAQKEKNDPGKVQECLSKIQGASQHLLSLINDVLDMSRIESGKTVIAHDPINIHTVTANCHSIIRGQLDDRDLELIVEEGSIAHPWLIGDELRIRQILINILGNAVKFTPDGGKIWFRVSETAADADTATIRYEIRDTGMGISQDFLGRIWDAFSQADGGARSKYKGTGLGMAITKQFVDLMDGTISVQSEVNVGSTFTVELPLPIDRSGHVSEELPENIDSLEGIRALLAEDNELNMEIATELLEDEGMTITPAVNGRLAVEQFRNNPPGTFDVILMDIMMPVMDGLEATRVIRATEGRPDAAAIPIIAMSANAFEEDIRKSLDAGMNAHLSKPINLDEVMKTISNYVKK